MNNRYSYVELSRLSLTQWDIVRQFRADNIAAGVTLLGKYSPAIRAYLSRKGFREEADDMTQLVYMKIIDWVKRKDFSEGKGTFRGMIKTCMHQVMHEQLQKQKLEATGLEIEPISDSDQSEWYDIYYEKLMIQAYAIVKERVEEATWLAFIAMNQEGKSPEETATQFGQDTQWAYDVKSRVTKMLKRILAGLDLDVP